VLRPGLLQGLAVLIAGPPAPLGAAVAEACSGLGARVCTCLPDGEDEAGVDAAVLSAGLIDMLVIDGGALFDLGAPAGLGLRACMDAAWNVSRAVVNHAFLLDGHSPTRRIVYLSPKPDAGAHARAARAGLENLARTLSVEWARHGINALAIAPGETTRAQEIATLTAYLASPAGSYFSGCLLDLEGR
jgi:citronellol/citronellal dehydrogenase